LIRLPAGLRREDRTDGRARLTGPGFLGQVANDVQQQFPQSSDHLSLTPALDRLHRTLEQKLSTLLFVKGSAIVLGFLGTCIGIIQALASFRDSFHAISGTDAAAGWSGLTEGLGGVAAALTSTITGVVVGSVLAQLVIHAARRLFALLEDRIEIVLTAQLLPQLRCNASTSPPFDLVALQELGSRLIAGIDAGNTLAAQQVQVLLQLEPRLESLCASLAAVPTIAAECHKVALQQTKSLRAVEARVADIDAQLTGLTSRLESGGDALTSLIAWVDRDSQRIDMNHSALLRSIDDLGQAVSHLSAANVVAPTPNRSSRRKSNGAPS
jgi:hypothetical protein